MKFRLIGAAFIAAASLVAPASAQEVVTNPGYCAQFYPNANCQNFGPGNPYRGSNSYQRRGGGNWYGSNAKMRSQSMRHHRNHKRMH
jgi:hypothetical protein